MEFSISKHPSKNLEPNPPREEEAFDFPSLPWVCQRRFAEICDGKTLKTFAFINSFTRRLSKRCHTIEGCQIRQGNPTYYWISCYCNEDEHCKGDYLQLVEEKIDVADEVYVFTLERKLTAEYFQKLPVNLYSNKTLTLMLNIELPLLKKLLTSNVKSFKFVGKIQMDYTLTDLMEFIELSLLKLDEFK